MARLRILYRDVDRTPYLYVLRDAAVALGLELELVRASFQDNYVGALLDGRVDVLAENYWGLQSLAAEGAPLVSVATTVTHLNETLIVMPDIERLDQLAGAKLAMRAHGPSALVAKLWLDESGPPGMVGHEVGEALHGRWGNWKAVASGECQAAFVTNILTSDPFTAGLTALPIDRFDCLVNLTLTTRLDVINDRADAVRQLVASAFVATRTFREDRDATLAILQREPQQLLNVDHARLGELYEILRDELAPTPVPTAAAIDHTYRMRLSDNPELTNFNPLTMWDLRFAREVGHRV